MRRGQVIVLGAAIALVATVLGLIAWRADATTAEPAVAPSTTASALVATPTAVAAETSPTSLADALPVPTRPVLTSVAVTSSPAPPAAAVVADAARPVDGPAAACPDTSHGAIVDRAAQRAWLCDGAAISVEMPITSAWSMPDPGTYPVYAKDLAATSTFGGHVSRMTNFVAFTYGERTGARIAFHSVPTSNDGSFVQTLDSVGDPGLRGESSGCIRVLPDDAARIWAWLSIGDEVHVIS
jgi:hypothetical protein